MFKELRSSAVFQTEIQLCCQLSYTQYVMKCISRQRLPNSMLENVTGLLLKAKKNPTTNQTKTTLEAIYSPGSGMDDKTIMNMKAGRADSLSRGDGNNKSLIR